MTMAREVEKLRVELMNAANVDRRTGILSSDLFFFELFDFSFWFLLFLFLFFFPFITNVDGSYMTTKCSWAIWWYHRKQ